MLNFVRSLSPNIKWHRKDCLWRCVLYTISQICNPEMYKTQQPKNVSFTQKSSKKVVCLLMSQQNFFQKCELLFDLLICDTAKEKAHKKNLEKIV